MYAHLHVKCRSDFNKNLNVLTNLKKLPCVQFYENVIRRSSVVIYVDNKERIDRTVVISTTRDCDSN
jgi:hypothetical protein